MREYKVGDEYLYRGNKYILLEFITHSYQFKDKKRDFVRKDRPVVYDIWAVINKNNEQLLLPIRQPSDSRNMNEESSLHEWKEAFIDNSLEVNILIDSYEEVIENKRDFSKPDMLLELQNKRNFEFINFLKNKSISLANNKLLKPAFGWKLLYYHRSIPSMAGHRRLNTFIKENPLLWEKMKQQIKDFKNGKQQKKRNPKTSSKRMVEI